MIRRSLRGAVFLLAALFWPHAAAIGGDLTYLVHAPASKSAHPPLILLLHGVGADEHDMIGLWAQLPKEFVVVSPRAPFVDAGGGYRWARKGDDREKDIVASRLIIDLLVDNAVKRFDADPKEVFLGGFSQGGIMTYDVALHEPGRFRGAIVLSGLLFPSALGAKGNWTKESFFIAHGTDDPRIPFASATAAQATLGRLGVPVAFHAYAGMRHEISDAETRDLSAWLQERMR